MSYFERVPVGVENIERDFDVLLHALASPLKLPALQGQIQVIASVTWSNYTRQTLIRKELGKLWLVSKRHHPAASQLFAQVSMLVNFKNNAKIKL